MKNNCKKAFTLVELLIVLGVISIVFVAYTASFKNTKYNTYFNKIDSDLVYYDHFITNYMYREVHNTAPNKETAISNLNKLLGKEYQFVDGKSVINNPFGNPYCLDIKFITNETGKYVEKISLYTALGLEDEYLNYDTDKFTGTKINPVSDYGYNENGISNLISAPKYICSSDVELTNSMIKIDYIIEME